MLREEEADGMGKRLGGAMQKELDPGAKAKKHARTEHLYQPLERRTRGVGCTKLDTSKKTLI